MNRRAFSEVSCDVPRTSTLKEDARQIEFVRFGQALKLESIIRGDAPTSLASARSGSIFKRAPWEPQCFYTSFEYSGTLVGDSFGENSLILASSNGTFLVKDDQSNQLIFDESFSVKQLTIVEDHGILIIRGGSVIHKENHRIHIFRLNDFREMAIRVRSKNDVKGNRLERTKGCHIYATSKGCKNRDLF